MDTSYCKRNILRICQEPGITLGTLSIISSVPRNIHLRQVPPFPFYKWENPSKPVPGHAAGKHTKWSSESWTRHETPMLSTKATCPSLENTNLNATYLYWGGKHLPMVLKGPVERDNNQAFISQHRTLQHKWVSISCYEVKRGKWYPREKNMNDTKGMQQTQ